MDNPSQKARDLPQRRAKDTPPDVTPLQLSACVFVAALAQNVDEQRGISTPNGTPETQAKVAALVKKRFFE